jgi:hypothetical protein
MTTPFGLLPNGTVPDPKLEHASDHRERAIGVLLSQLRDKPRFTKLIEILIRPFQEIEDVIFQLYTMRRLDSAQGVQLDIIGRIVDEERGGLLDDDYRAIIRIKVRVLFSRGTGPDLIKITQLFLASDDFNYAEFYPATVEITATALVTAAQLTLLKRFLRRAKSGGVRLDMIDGTGGLGTRFHYGTEGTGVGYGVGTYGGVI